MTEEQLKALPAFRTLPIYDEHDERADSITSGQGRKVRECTTIQEVEDCLKNPRLAPLGALRVRTDDQEALVAYFAQLP